MIKYTKNATIVRVQAMYGKRLKQNDYRELAGKKSVSEVADYLKRNTHYSSALSTINPLTIHRGHLESILRRYSFERYISLCDFQQLRKEKFYNYLLVLSEIREILSVILHINAGNSDEYISSLPSYLVSKTSFDLIQLARVRSIKDLMEVIRHTPYHSVLEKVFLQSEGKADYLLCEYELRMYYFKWLIDVVNKDLKGKARDSLVSQIKMQIDFIDIINAYRMKKYYDLSADEIDKRSFSFYGRLNSKKYRQLLETPSEEEFFNALSKTYYGKRMNFENENFENEIILQRSLLARKSLRFSEDAAVSIYSVMYLFDIELSNIIKIIEGIRYNRSSEYILGIIISMG